MLFLVPGDPVKIMLAEFVTTPEQVARMREQLHLDEPILKQYGRFVGNALRGDLGTSIRSRRAVSTEISENVGSTAQLALASMAVGVAVGVPLGLTAALFPTSRFGAGARGGARRVEAELLARPADDLRLLAAPRLVSRHRRRRPLAPRAAGRDSGDDRLGDHRAPHALEHARGARSGLREDRARQGAGVVGR